MVLKDGGVAPALTRITAERGQKPCCKHILAVISKALFNDAAESKRFSVNLAVLIDLPPLKLTAKAKNSSTRTLASKDENHWIEREEKQSQPGVLIVTVNEG